MKRQISERRQGAYYIGAALMILGGLLFASVFLTFFLHFGDFSDFNGRARSSGFRALGGMGLVAVGAMLRRMGARGLAGSGALLDPDKARKDLEPYSRMAGGMLHDAMDAFEKSGTPGEQVTGIKCRECGHVNHETDKLCSQCGKPL